MSRTLFSADKSFMVRVFKNIVVISFIIFAFLRINIPEDSYNLITNDELNQIEEILKKDPGLAALRLEKLLTGFYKTVYPNRGEIFPDPDNAPPGSLEKPMKRQDQLLRSLITAKQSPFFIGNAPNLFRAHWMLARAYALTKQYYKAADHFLNAMRYRSLKLTPEVWADKNRMKLAGDDADVERQAEEFLKARDEYAAALGLYNDKLKEKHFEIDKAAESSTPQNEINNLIEKYDNELNNLKKEVQQKQQDYEIQLEFFKLYETKYNAESALFLRQTADIFKTIDEKILESKKIASEDNQYTTPYNRVSRQYWQNAGKHIAYINLLELAVVLDLKNARAPYLLGSQHGKNNNITRAIHALLLALKYNENADVKLTVNEEIDAHLQLGGYYKRSRKYVDAIYHYEKALSLTDAPEFHLRLNAAKIHAHHTGNYARAKELLDGLVGDLPGLNENELQKLKTEYDIWSLYTHIFERTGALKEITRTLENARNIHVLLEKRLAVKKEELSAKYKQLLDEKKEMTGSRKRQAIQQYYKTLEEYRKLQKEISELTVIRNGMDLKKIYFTLARQKEIERNIEEAINTYREAELYGIHPDEARREILRLKEKYHIKN